MAIPLKHDIIRLPGSLLLYWGNMVQPVGNFPSLPYMVMHIHNTGWLAGVCSGIL